MTIDKIHNLLLEEDENLEQNAVPFFAIEPPLEAHNALTDYDSDASDDDVICNSDNFPRRILLTKIINSSLDNQSNNDLNKPSTLTSKPAKEQRKKVTHKWHADKIK